MKTYVTVAIRPQNFALQPRKIVDAHSVFLTADCNQDILTFEDFHLLKTSSTDQLVNLTLSAPIQQHQAVLGSDQQIYTCKIRIDYDPKRTISHTTKKDSPSAIYAPHNAAQRISLLKRFLYLRISGVSDAKSWLVGVTLTFTWDSLLAGPAPNPKVRKERCFC